MITKKEIPFVIRPGGFYKGEFKKWYPHEANKIKIEGRFENWIANGPGEIHFPDGDKYQGDLKNNRMHGKGAYTHANGTMWVSDFVKNNASGRGKIFYSSGRVYEGEILNWVPVFGARCIAK